MTKAATGQDEIGVAVGAGRAEPVVSPKSMRRPLWPVLLAGIVGVFITVVVAVGWGAVQIPPLTVAHGNL